MRRGVDALQQEREARDVGVDLVEDVGERDHVAGALRDADLLARLHQLHQLTEQHLGLALGVAERLHAGLERLHLSVVVGAPDVDEVLPPALELVAVVRDVVAQVGGGTVGLHQHAVALVAEVGGAQPGGAVVLEHDAARAEVVEHALHVAGFVQRAFREPGVEVHADAGEIVLQGAHVVAVAPVLGLLLGDRVAELGPHDRGHVDQVLTLVAVLGRLAALVAGEQRRRERVELVAGVVQVVLAVHDRALGREEVGQRVADRHPAATAGVERAGGVGRHELEVDAQAVERVAVAVGLALRDHRQRAPRAARSGARWRLRKPGPAISTRSRWAGRARSSSSTMPGGDVAGRHARAAWRAGARRWW